MRRRFLLFSGLLSAIVFVAIAAKPPQKPAYTVDFDIQQADALVPGGNEYFPLQPGAYFEYQGQDDDEEVLITFNILPQIRMIRFQAAGGWKNVRTRIVEERQWTDGELTEVAFSYYACCPHSGNVYNFGEDATQYEDGQVVGHEGSWLAGKNGAKPGLHLPGFFLLGSRYHQEVAPGVAMGCAENVAMGLSVDTSAGQFKKCVMTLETSPLEPDEEVLKTYAPGVGLIADGALKLTNYRLR